MSEKVEKLVNQFRTVLQDFYDSVKAYGEECALLSDEEKEEYAMMVGKVPMGLLLVARAHPVEGDKDKTTFAINLSYPSPTGMDDPIIEGAMDMFVPVMRGLEPMNAISMAIQVATATIRASGMSSLEVSNKIAAQVLDEGLMTNRFIQSKFQERMKAMAEQQKVRAEIVPVPPEAGQPPVDES